MPNPFFRQLGLGLLLAAALPAAEPETFTRDLKIRWGMALGSQDNLRPAAFSFGLNLGFRLGEGTLGAELGYHYKTGDGFVVPVQGEAPAGLEKVNHAKAGDSRRNQVDGLAVRVSWSQPLCQDWTWQVGAMLGGTRFRHEYVGDVQGEAWEDGNAHSWRDTYSGTPVKGGLTVSPYAGTTWRLSRQSSLEFNVLALNYKALNYVHVPGSGVYKDSHHGTGLIADHNAFPADRLETKTRFVPHVEIGYVLHF